MFEVMVRLLIFSRVKNIIQTVTLAGTHESSHASLTNSSIWPAASNT